MKYPKIHSISTVGILRHYNQDFLIHETRTDFIGNNGTGKSIIADLLQLIFIPDGDKFSFGTDAKDRRLSALPHNTSEAYAFLNIEVLKDVFVTIGVRVGSGAKETIPVRPFIIINQEDTTRPINEVGFDRSKLLYSKHFISNDNKIPLIKDLGKHIRDNHGLSLHYYTKRKDKNDYYDFLYKHIVPINLTKESSFKAFANILQSFSRAKSLKTTDSRSLKNFLFEKSHEIEEAYHSKKEQLDGLLDSYKEMSEKIDELTAKQKALDELYSWGQDKKTANDDYLKAKFNHAKREVEDANTDYEVVKTKLEEERSNKTNLENRISQANRNFQLLAKEIAYVENEIAILRSYKEKYAELNEIQQSISRLNTVEIPMIDFDFGDSKENLTNYTDSGLISIAASYKILHEKYGSLSDIQQKCKEQGELIEDEKQKLKSEVQNLKNVLEIFDHKKEGSLFNEVIKTKQALSKAQESVLYHLIETYWQKPAISNNNKGELLRYVTDLAVLNEASIADDEDTNGYWVNFGSIVEYVPQINEDKRLLEDPENIEMALKEAANTISHSIKQLEQKFQGLGLFQTGELSEVEGIDLVAEIVDWRKIVKEAYLTHHFKDRIEQRRNEYDKVKARLEQLESQITIPLQKDNLEQQVKQRETLLATKRDQNNSCIAKKSGFDNELKHCIANISSFEKGIQDKKETLKNAELNLAEISENEIREYFKELLLESEAKTPYSKEDVEALKEVHEHKKLEYDACYQRIAKIFSVEENPEIKEQYREKSYGYPILEKVLLGQIGRKDDISGALHNCNNKRLEFARMIRENIINIFSKTNEEYESCIKKVRDLNNFFKKHKISNQYYFKIERSDPANFDISWIRKLEEKGISLFDEIQFGDSVHIDDLIQGFFKKASGLKEKIKLSDLLNPKTYFELATKMVNDEGVENSGSTGETYTAIVLLGIGRLSVLSEKEEGLRFIILEEIANLDKTNFGTFPNIAKDFGYQIMTMTPSPYGSDSSEGWYLHHLAESSTNMALNSPDLISYFKTNQDREDLKIYLSRTQ